MVRRSVEFGIFAVAHLGIIAHREFRRGFHNLPPGYHEISLQVEHVVSHATRPLLFSALLGLDLNQFSDVVLASFYGFVSGCFVDGIIPYSREGRFQWDQLLSDLAGVGLFFGSSIYVSK